MFTQQHIKEVILKLEMKYPVDTWQVNNIHVWPLIRIKLYIHMLMLMNKTKGESSSEINKDGAIKQGNLLLKFLRFNDLIKAFVILFFFYKKLQNKKVVFFGSHIHRVFKDGKYFNRFYDSMVETHNLHTEVYMIEYQRLNLPLYNQNAVIDLNKNLNAYKLVSKFKKKFKQKEIQISLSEYSEFYKEVRKMEFNFSTLKLSRNDVIKWSEKVNSNISFFHKFYKKTNPKKVVFLGFYGLDDLYSALVAANGLGITTVDFQHGPQTNMHLAFAHWNKIPETGYNTMPTEFWNWDETSRNNINLWANKVNHIKSKVVGQPYLGYWVNNNKQTKKEEYILYSLQTYPFTIQDFLTAKVVSLIKQMKEKWVLRLHPRNNLDLNELNYFIESQNLNYKIKIQNAYTSPLPESIINAKVHITNYSGCLIESMQLGVPTVLINEVGREIFSQYIDNKLVYYLDQNSANFEEEIINLIGDFQGKHFEKDIVKVFNPIV